MWNTFICTSRTSTTYHIYPLHISFSAPQIHGNFIWPDICKWSLQLKTPNSQTSFRPAGATPFRVGAVPPGGGGDASGPSAEPLARRILCREDLQHGAQFLDLLLHTCQRDAWGVARRRNGALERRTCANKVLSETKWSGETV